MCERFLLARINTLETNYGHECTVFSTIPRSKKFRMSSSTIPASEAVKGSGSGKLHCVGKWSKYNMIDPATDLRINLPEVNLVH